jgi:hypothetical protein
MRVVSKFSQELSAHIDKHRGPAGCHVQASKEFLPGRLGRLLQSDEICLRWIVPVGVSATTDKLGIRREFFDQEIEKHPRGRRPERLISRERLARNACARDFSAFGHERMRQ